VKLTGAIQESLISILCFVDGVKGARFVRNLIPHRAYDPFYREIAEAAFAYIDRYGVPPGEQTKDLIDALCARNEKRAPVFRKLFESMVDTAASIHVDYIIDSAQAFVRYQRVRMGLDLATTAMDRDTVDGLEEAESALSACLKASIDVFDPGTAITDEGALDFLTDEDDTWPTGIKELDARNLGPGPGRLYLLIALAKGGKSWFLLNLAKHTLLHGRRCVVYITLELKRPLVLKRAFQVFFGLSTRELSAIKRPKFKRDDDGYFLDLEMVDVRRHTSMDAPGVEAKLRKFQSRLRNRPKFIVKEFPSGELSLRGLTAYLDGLESHGIIPDLICLDYADLMELDSHHLRESTRATYVGLRGLAQKRNIGIATVTQSNRSGTKQKQVDVYNASEDFGKIAVADTVLTLSRTDEEKQLGLARLFVAAGREDADRFTILLSQRFEVGQFALDSCLMTDDYWRAMSGDADLDATAEDEV